MFLFYGKFVEKNSTFHPFVVNNFTFELFSNNTIFKVEIFDIIKLQFLVCKVDAFDI